MNLFLIGSGFTKALFPDAPLNDDLLPQLCKNSENCGCRELFERYETNDIEICLTKLDIDKTSNREEGKLVIIDPESEKMKLKMQRYYETSVSEDVVYIQRF